MVNHAYSHTYLIVIYRVKGKENKFIEVSTLTNKCHWLRISIVHCLNFLLPAAANYSRPQKNWQSKITQFNSQWLSLNRDHSGFCGPVMSSYSFSVTLLCMPNSCLRFSALWKIIKYAKNLAKNIEKPFSIFLKTHFSTALPKMQKSE